MKLKRPPQERGKHVHPPDSINVSTEHLCPVFSMRYLQKNYCISNCTTEEKASFADTMRLLSSLSWMQIKTTHRHGIGSEKIPSGQIKAGLPQVVTEDVTLLALRFCGKAPMVGFRDRDVFHILWFDRDFTLYPHS